MTDVTCPTACVEFNHPGMEHDQWIGSVRILATVRAYEAQEEDRKAELDDLTARLARVEALAEEPVIPYPAECQCAHGMGFQFHQYPCRYAHNIPRSALRAALAAAPSREGES